MLNIRAEEDLTRIYAYGLERFGLLQADRYYDMLFDCFSKIASNPFLFPEAVRFREGYRYCVCGVDTVFYRINIDKIEIMAIIGRQIF
ncbi:MAG: type II toxin-antitoxin system RelE/ParE family toxin [Gelidibacter sp.]